MSRNSMWQTGALVGILIGLWIHHDLWGTGMIIGGLIGYALSRRRGASAAPDLPARLQALEAEVAALRHEMAALHPAGAAMPAVSAPRDEERPAPTPAVVPEPETPQQQPAEPLPEPPTFEMPAWLQKLWAGNPLAKVGIVLLFFGVASGLRLVVDQGLLPVPLRLFIVAAAGMAMIVFGIAKGRDAERRNFGLALQGGGFALLYLAAYFMLARYSMIGQGFGFALFAALGVACVVLAARQDGPALAVLGLSGAFLAPVLAGGRADSPLGLFSFFALLNAFILTVDWFKSWRVLNVAGFIFTLAVGMVWAMDAYEPRHYAVTQSFLVLFLVAYSAMPALTALLRAPGLSGWQDGMLLFGTPLIGAFLQAQLLEGERLALAWSALIGALWYFALWALLFRRPGPEIRLVERSHLGIALALLTVAVPLAFDAQITSAFWAAEGAAVLWFGVRQRRRLAQGTGLAMQFIAGGALLLGWQALGHRLPVANDAMLGAAILTLAGLFSARQLRGALEATPVTGLHIAPALPAVWALLWWLGAGLGEIHRFAPHALHAPFGLLFVAATVACLEGLARLWRWPQIRATALLLTAGLWLAALATIDRAGHPFAGMMALLLPLTLVLHTALVALHERLDTLPYPRTRHLGGWWLLLFALAFELAWQAQRHMPVPALWAFVSVTGICAAGSAMPAWGARRGLWPFSSPAGHYACLGLLPPLAVLALLLPWGNIQLSGTEGLGWPYLPLINAFDLTQLAGIGALLLGAWAWADGPETHRRAAQGLRLLASASAFLWLSALAARIAHHWGGIPFEVGRMMDATLFQALLSLFWSTTAITTMIIGSKRQRRPLWIGGFALLGMVGAKLLLFDAAGRGTLTWTATLIGVALLVLAASYFAPLPPKAAK